MNNRPLFNHVHDMVAPITEAIFVVVKEELQEGFSYLKDSTISFFSNTNSTEDRVQEKASSSFKREDYEGSYTDEEIEILRRVMRED